MRNYRYHRFIGLCLIISVLFAGMYLHIGQVDSFFSTASLHDTTSAIIHLNQDVTTPLICTPEMLGHHKTVYTIISTRRTEDKKLVQIRLFSILSLLFLSIFIHICASITAELHHDILGCSSTIRYIHDQDGEKSFF